MIFWLFISTHVHGQTLINATSGLNYYQITLNETWDYDTKYIINCDIKIENGGSLTIIPKPSTTTNVNIIMAQGSRIQIIEGALRIVGDASRLIKLTPRNPTDPSTSSNTWLGLEFDAKYYRDVNNNQDYSKLNTYHSEIKHSIIEYTYSHSPTGGLCGGVFESNAAVYLKDFNNINIENSELRYNSALFLGGAVCIITKYNTSNIINGYPIIKNNKIFENASARGAGICILGNGSANPAYANIESNDIFNNIATRSGGAIAVFKGSDVTISSNTISSNTANCNKISSTPHYTGGGGIVIGLYSNCLIYSNDINNNISNYNSLSNDRTGLGGGILVRLGSTVEIQNNSINNNYATEGAAIAVYGKDAAGGFGSPSYITAYDNSIFDNSAQVSGGGFLIDHSSCELTFNSIYSNFAKGGSGGGIHIMSSTYNATTTNIPIKLYNNTIFGNTSYFGGGIFADGDYSIPSLFITEIELINNLIHSNNSSTNGAGIFFGAGLLDVNVNNNTISKNYSDVNSNGDALFIPNRYDDSKFSFVNNILFYNGNPYDCQVYFPLVQSGEFDNNDIMFLGCQIDPQNNFDIVPEFVNLAGNNFQLASYSPLIDLGQNNVLPVANEDIVHSPRFINQIDLGAYEYNGGYSRHAKPNSSTIIVFPNPTSEFIYVQSNDEIKSILIYSSESKLVYSITNVFSSFFKINVSIFNSGIYFVEVKTLSNIEYHKIIKEN